MNDNPPQSPEHAHPPAPQGPPMPAGAPTAPGAPAAPAPAAASMPGQPADETGLKTHSEFYRLPSRRWWKGVIAIVALAAVMLLASTFFTFVAVIIDTATGTLDPQDVEQGNFGMTPLILLATNLSLASLLVVALILHRFLFRQRIGLLNSVTGRFRWKWAAWSLIPIGIGFAIYITFTAIASLSGGHERLSSGLLLTYLAIILLTTPLQAAAEEYVFRGILQRVAGSWVRGRMPAFILGTAVSSVLFGAAHAATDPWLILYYWIFGVFLSFVAHYTGGLEAPILIHVINNTALFVAATFSGEIVQQIDRSAGNGGPFMLIPIAAILVISAATIILARVRRVEMAGVAEDVPSRGAAPAGPVGQSWGPEAPAPLPHDHYARADAGQPAAPEAGQPQQFGAGWQDGQVPQQPRDWPEGQR